MNKWRLMNDFTFNKLRSVSTEEGLLWLVLWGLSRGEELQTTATDADLVDLTGWPAERVQNTLQSLVKHSLLGVTPEAAGEYEIRILGPVAPGVRG